MSDETTEPTRENLLNALTHIRLAASMHYLGGAFDPEHMRSIANLCIRALCGEDVPALPSPEDIHARSAAAAEEWQQIWD